MTSESNNTLSNPLNELTTLKRTIEQQQVEIFQLRSIIDNLPGDIYWKDREGVYLGINVRGRESLRKMGFPWELTDIVGKTDYDLFHKETAEKFRKNDLQVMQGRVEKTNEEEAILPSGERIVQLSTKRPLKNESGHVVGLVANTVDVTYLKKIETDLRAAKEKAEAANNAKSEFIANMSHDIRTPLAGVINAAEVLLNMLKSEESLQFVGFILTSSKRLLELLNGILAMIALDNTNEKDVHLETFNLRDRLNGLRELELASVKSKHLDFNLIIDPKIPCYVISDRVKLERILLNLIGNAIKFTQKGRINLKATLLKEEEKTVDIEFVVADTGIGISKDQISQIFDRFYQVTPSYQGEYVGHGIGLYIVKQFVELLGGTIQIDSEVGKGTSFIFVLKLQKEIADPLRVTTASTPPQPKREMRAKREEPCVTSTATPIVSPLRREVKVRILLVEDHLIMKISAQKLLEDCGADVETAGEGLKALQMAKKGQYDLILSDVGLPGGMSGDEFIAAYRYWEKTVNKPAVPIIGLTAHSDEEIKANCLFAGMNEVFSKPLSKEAVDSLLSRLSSLAGKHSEATSHPGLSEDLPETEAQLFELEETEIFDEQSGVEVLGRKERLIKVVNTLLKNSFPNEISVLETAHAIGDWRTIENTAHNLKGISLYCGALRMKLACQYMERAIKAGLEKQYENLYQQMRRVIEITTQQLKDWLEQNSY